MRCKDCGVTFARRWPGDAELDDHYRGYGHAWFDSSITRLRYRELLATFEPHRRTNGLLDIGCGAGYFLEEARTRGWRVWGSEYGGRALEMARARGLEVFQAPLTLDTFAAASFDVVTAFEVFEHLRDPVHEAEVVAHVLRPGGLLYCTTPNFNSLSRRVLGPWWNVVDYPEHLWYFTPRTLRDCLGRLGFVPERLDTTGVSIHRLRRSLHPMAAGARSAYTTAAATTDDERLRGAIESSGLLRAGRATINAALSAVGAGDTTKGWFRRSNL